MKPAEDILLAVSSPAITGTIDNSWSFVKLPIAVAMLAQYGIDMVECLACNDIADDLHDEVQGHLLRLHRVYQVSLRRKQIPH